jgi:NAD(P)-dependent dehydrogenase (short-subunit alcohol dehydrogenase family)
VRVLITGSTDGVGLATARALVAEGHEVIAHARNSDRAAERREPLAGVSKVLIGDLASKAETVALAAAANEVGDYDVIIHNAGIGSNEPRQLTTDGIEHVLAINAIAPYILTCLIRPPARLMYVTSGQHLNGTPHVADMNWDARPWNPLQAYADSKLFESTVAFAVARMWPNVVTNTLEPGWVPTKMAGYDAPDDLELAHVTQLWLALSEDELARTSGSYFYHQEAQPANPIARHQDFQDRVLEIFAELTGVTLPDLRDRAQGAEADSVS